MGTEKTTYTKAYAELEQIMKDLQEDKISVDDLSKKVKRADAETVKTATGFAIGGVPPFGHSASLPVYVDADLLQFEVVWAAAGTPYAVFALRPDDLVRASQGMVADLKQGAASVSNSLTNYKP